MEGITPYLQCNRFLSNNYRTHIDGRQERTSVKCMDHKNSDPVFLCRLNPWSLQRHLSKCALCCLCGATLQVPKLSQGSATAGKLRVWQNEAIFHVCAGAGSHTWVCSGPNKAPIQGRAKLGGCILTSLHASQAQNGDLPSSERGERQDANGWVRQDVYL